MVPGDKEHYHRQALVDDARIQIELRAATEKQISQKLHV